MKIKFTLLCASVLLSASLSAQFQWVNAIGGSGADVGNSITTDASGNVYTTGKFQSTVDFDAGPGTTNLTSAGFDDVFVTKHGPSGNLLWAVNMGGGSNESGNAITVDASGNIYITGVFYGVGDYDPGAGVVNLNAATETVFIVKLNSTGTLAWARQLTSVSAVSNYSNSIAVDASGNVYTAGAYEGTVDFDPGPGSDNFISQGGTDAFVSKLDSAGTHVWARMFQGTSSEVNLGLDVDAAGNLVLTGRFSGTTDFDPNISTLNLTSNGSTDIFISKLDASGGIIWAKQIGGSSYDCGNALVTDGTNNIYATGYYVETVDFDPGAGVSNLTGAMGAGQTFALKLDASGNFLWAKTALNTIAGSEGKTIAFDASGIVYIAGYYQNDADVNPGAGVTNLPVEGSDESFITAIDVMGYFMWATHFNCGSSDIIYGIATGSGGAIYTTGYYFGTADFDPTGQVASRTSNGQQDAFIHRLGDCLVVTEVTSTGTTLMATAAVTGYQWIDCANGQPIVGATDQTFTPGSPGSYQALISTGSCSDTTPCVVITRVTEHEVEVFTAYPNPTTGILTIQLNTSNDALIEVFNATGQLLLSERALNNVVTIEFPQETGIYLVRVTIEGATSTQKVIKE
jgi:hypothetical protein